MPDEIVSKTKRKQEMHALQALGVALVALPEAQLRLMGLPGALELAILEAKRIKSHGARRRQMQYIGRLMRDVDAGPLRAALAAWARGPQAERAQFALVERWRDRVLQEPDGINAFADAYPGAPRESLASLAAAARDEQARSAPPHKSRELFRTLKRIIEGAPP